MLCAIIDNGKVIETRDMSIEEIQAEGARYNIVDISNTIPAPQVDWTFNGIAFVPPPGTSNEPFMKITKLAFLSRFTAAEAAGLEAFAIQNNNYAAALRVAMRKQQVSNYMDLSRQDTIDGVNNLVALGLLTTERATVILTTPPTEIEKYRGQQ